jgi:hypothetical protein
MYSWLSLSRTRLTRISGWVEFLSKSRYTWNYERLITLCKWQMWEEFCVQMTMAYMELWMITLCDWQMWEEFCVQTTMEYMELWTIILCDWKMLGEVYKIQHNVIKFVSDLRQFGGFFLVFRFPPAINLTAAMQLIYCWKWRYNTINQNQLQIHFIEYDFFFKQFA